MLWGCCENEWVDLPGPPELWLDVAPIGQRGAADYSAIEWYEHAGFKPGPPLKQKCWQKSAYHLFMDKSILAPKDWMQHISLKEGADLAWRFKKLDLTDFEKTLDLTKK